MFSCGNQARKDISLVSTSALEPIKEKMFTSYHDRYDRMKDRERYRKVVMEIDKKISYFEN